MDSIENEQTTSTLVRNTAYLSKDRNHKPEQRRVNAIQRRHYSIGNSWIVEPHGGGYEWSRVKLSAASQCGGIPCYRMQVEVRQAATLDAPRIMLPW